MVMIDAGGLEGERARLIKFLKSKLGGVESSGDLLRLGCGSKEARLEEVLPPKVDLRSIKSSPPRAF